jgi:hypothetical protein
VSHRDRRRAEVNRAIREQQARAAAGSNEPQIEISVTMQCEDMPEVEHTVWRSDGRRYDAMRERRDAKVELLFRSARAAGWPYKAAIALGIEALRRTGRGASEKLVEAIIAKRCLPESALRDAGWVEAIAKQYGLGTINGCNNK